MKKLLITVCLSGLLSVPSVVLGAEMAGASLYGSFRTGLTFGSGDAEVGDFTSRWGFKGSHEVSEGLTASYKYEAKMNTTNAETAGGAGHGHGGYFATGGGDFTSAQVDIAGAFMNSCSDSETAFTRNADSGDLEAVDAETVAEVRTEDVTCGNWFDAVTGDGGPGGRLSQISLSGGFGTITLGQIWSASANHYGFAVDPSYVNGVFGGASYRPGNTVSYSSSAGDVSFQIDKVTGAGERIEFGASANLGPVGVGLGYWDNANDEGTFTGVAISAGAAGVNLTIGLGSTDYVDTETGKGEADTSILHVGGSLGDSGVSYAVQVSNTDEVYGPAHKHAGKDKSQNLIVLTNSLGSGASIIFEHLDPADLDSSSLIGLKVDF